jgi:hypothetical protein
MLPVGADNFCYPQGERGVDVRKAGGSQALSITYKYPPKLTLFKASTHSIFELSRPLDYAFVIPNICP